MAAVNDAENDYAVFTDEDADTKISTVLPWDKFSVWIHCICIVTFDLELGQAIETIYPGHVQLSEQEKSNICYLAFPDSNSGCMGDTQFHMRIRQSSGHSSLLPDHIIYNQRCPVYLQVDAGYFYGYVYFRQVKDKSLPRGYFQKRFTVMSPMATLVKKEGKEVLTCSFAGIKLLGKQEDTVKTLKILGKSFVIMSRFPFVRLFMEICALIAPRYFENGEMSIEAATHEIDQWRNPIPGEMLTLSLLGTVFQVHIPGQSNKSGIQVSPSSASEQCVSAVSYTGMSLNVLPSLCEVNIFKCFAPVISHIHLLWELVLTAEPVVVMAASPTTCSEMVQALISMITPLMYCADFRPYFTIHDSEFREYTTKSHAPPPVILGVTNPFFVKTLQHWPHIIRVCESPLFVTSSKHKLKNGSNVKLVDSKPGVYTHYQPFLHKDKNILKKLLKGIQTKRPVEVQTALLRRHLLELTQSFMIPLERYMASLMPLQKNISPYKAAPVPQPFNPDEFLATLGTSGPQLTTGIKGDWVGLYRRFFRSTNFSGWYNARYHEVHQKLQALQLEALSYADMKLWVQGKHEVEVVDMILTIRHKLEQSEIENLPLSNATRDQLQSRMADIICTLPDDLKTVLKTS